MIVCDTCAEQRADRSLESKEMSLAPPLFLQTIEDTGFSTWLRESESPFAFYFILLFHTFGLALLVGANMIVDLRLLELRAAYRSRRSRRLFRIMWIGFRHQCRHRHIAGHCLSDEVAHESGLLYKIGDHRFRRMGHAEA